MHGAVPSLPQYIFMELCLIKQKYIFMALCLGTGATLPLPESTLLFFQIQREITASPSQDEIFYHHETDSVTVHGVIMQKTLT
jgi:hypothetical protein